MKFFQTVGLSRNLNELGQTLFEVIMQILEKLDGHQIVGISVTGQGSGTWLIDEDGSPVGRGWLWLDTGSC